MVNHSPSSWNAVSGGWTEDGEVFYVLHGVKVIQACDALRVAAAPDLLKALEWALGEIDAIEEVTGQIVDLDDYAAARAALAKATGEEAFR